MSENNNIARIAKIMNDPTELNNEINTAVNVLKKHFSHRFLEPIQNDISTMQTECISKPSNEVALLQACRPFIKSDYLETAITVFNNIDVAKNLTNGITTQNITADNSVHFDGVYDVDKNCIVKSENKHENKGFPVVFAVILLLLFYDNVN